MAFSLLLRKQHLMEREWAIASLHTSSLETNEGEKEKMGRLVPSKGTTHDLKASQWSHFFTFPHSGAKPIASGLWEDSKIQITAHGIYSSKRKAQIIKHKIGNRAS